MLGRNNRSIWKGLAAGAVGGLAAAYVMNLFQQAWSLVEGQNPGQGTEQQGGRREEEVEKPKEGEPATVKAASAVSEEVFHHQLTREEKKMAGPAVHYAFGAMVGGIYGALAEAAPVVTSGAGLPFGAAVWLAADEAAVPALGLSKAPTAYPVKTHIEALGMHLVYGLTTEYLRGLLFETMSGIETMARWKFLVRLYGWYRGGITGKTLRLLF